MHTNTLPFTCRMVTVCAGIWLEVSCLAQHTHNLVTGAIFIQHKQRIRKLLPYQTLQGFVGSR